MKRRNVNRTLFLIIIIIYIFIIIEELHTIENFVATDISSKALPFILSETLRIQNRTKEAWNIYGFNEYLSNMISVQRKLPDVRDKRCKTPHFSTQHLPKTDIIICFHNEAWSTLLRTIHSIINQSPSDLIGKIIIVDDFSDMSHLKKPLDDYFRAYPQVKILRAVKRLGLIRARLFGIKYSSAEILTFLDSHCECTPGWLEPLLARIAQNSTNVICPIIDTIKKDTLKYHYEDNINYIYNFFWNLEFKIDEYREHEGKYRTDNTEPYPTAVMLGGLFSINRKFFEKLGTYDSGLEIWGGENMELSFKIWMCGGRLEISPCSFVGHLFHTPKNHLYNYELTKRNLARVAEVWLDDYAKYFYAAIGGKITNIGNLTERIELRKNLKCKNFQWYMDKVYPELISPKECVAYGQIRNLDFNKQLCLGLLPNDQFEPIFCDELYDFQFWLLTKRYELINRNKCLTHNGVTFQQIDCMGSEDTQKWFYDEKTKQFRYNEVKCLAFNENSIALVLEKCRPDLKRQQWSIENFSKDKMHEKVSHKIKY